MAKKNKRKTPKARNPYVMPARTRKGAGAHKDKRKRRAKEHKGGSQYLDEDKA